MWVWAVEYYKMGRLLRAPCVNLKGFQVVRLSHSDWVLLQVFSVCHSPLSISLTKDPTASNMLFLLPSASNEDRSPTPPPLLHPSMWTIWTSCGHLLFTPQFPLPQVTSMILTGGDSASLAVLWEFEPIMFLMFALPLPLSCSNISATSNIYLPNIFTQHLFTQICPWRMAIFCSHGMNTHCSPALLLSSLSYRDD